MTDARPRYDPVERRIMFKPQSPNTAITTKTVLEVERLDETLNTFDLLFVVLVCIYFDISFVLSNYCPLDVGNDLSCLFLEAGVVGRGWIAIYQHFVFYGPFSYS